MKNIKYMLMITALLIVAQTASAVIIQSVTHNSANVIELGGILDSGDYYSPARQNHVYKDDPSDPTLLIARELFGTAEYIRVSHDDRNNATYEMTVTLATGADVYLFIDDRVSTVATKMPWVAAMGFVDTGEAMKFDESNDGTFENPFSIYKGKLGKGVHKFGAQASGSINMYGVAAVAGDPIAADPTPADGQGLATDPASDLFPPVDITTNLSWVAPDSEDIDPNFPVEYQVFMDPNESKVIAGAGCEYWHNYNAATMYDPPSDLDYTKTYFWKVDTKLTLKGKTDPNVFSGPAWSFKTVAEDKAPIALAGQSIRTWLAKAQGGTVQLQGSVLFPEDDSTAEWTAYKAAFPGSVPASEVTFADASNPATTVTITATGEYILQLTATDDDYPVIPKSVSQMKVIVYDTPCQVAQNTAGYVKNPYDFDDNCVVNLDDLALFAKKWLNSTVATADVYYAATVTEPSAEALFSEYWLDVPGGSDPNLLLADPRYPNNPTGRDLLTGQFKFTGLNKDHYGMRTRGYIVAPATGAYTFYITSDDNSRLFLSTDTDPANAVMIAHTGYTGETDWEANTTQVSALQNLTAGQYYYVEVLLKENTGADRFAVGWKKPGDTTIEVVPGSVLRWYLP